MFGRYFLKEMENIFEQNLILFQCAVVRYQSVRGEGTIQSHLISKDGMIQILILINDIFLLNLTMNTYKINKKIVQIMKTTGFKHRIFRRFVSS